MVGVPPEGIGMILGVNHFLDMCRTTLNVTGDLALATAGVAQGEPRRAEPERGRRRQPGQARRCRRQPGDLRIRARPERRPG